ncbi:MAG: HPr family phosphocarrier protein [Acholeplasmatales bacterium]|nr:HPr family phosphocarrier protein [Acholeplasmatales bacterium]
MKKEIKLEIKDNNGLHARKCLEICKAAQSFKSDLALIHNNIRIDVKSILGLLSLACTKGEIVTLEATGDDASNAIDLLSSLVC